uniref:PB1-like domain-containing protein n=1 Tax=Quercus lobata TaxID=97700 RepID=A0A7N2L7Q2_QUELO
MADLNFIVEINYGGTFVWNQNLEYVGGNIATIEDVDLNRLSFCEIQDMCEKFGAPSTSTYHYLIPRGKLEQGLRLITGDDEVLYMCEIHVAWLIDRIVLYVEGSEKPLVVEILGQNVKGIEERVVEGDNLDYDDDANVSEVDEEVHVDGEGDKVLATKQNEGSEFDWLEEGFEGLDFDDDVFGNMDARPST